MYTCEHALKPPLPPHQPLTKAGRFAAGWADAAAATTAAPKREHKTAAPSSAVVRCVMTLCQAAGALVFGVRAPVRATYNFERAHVIAGCVLHAGRCCKLKLTQ